MNGLARKIVEDVESFISTRCCHDSPQVERSFFNHDIILPTLNRVAARLRKGAVTDPEGNANHLKRVRWERDRSFPGFEDLLASVLQNADDVSFPLSSTFGQGEKDAELSVKERVRWFVDRMDVPD
jgi:hypothetical protein